MSIDIQPLNESACNHEEMRTAFRVANANFAALKAVTERLIADLEDIKRSCPRPT